jgi:Poly(3-hydroxyalkanoate) synthetase
MKKSDTDQEYQINTLDPFGIMPVSMSILEAWSRHPDKLQERMQDFCSGLMDMQRQVIQRSMGNFIPDSVAPVSADERFRDQAWSESPWFDFLKEYYLLCTRTVEDAIYSTPDVPEKKRRQAAFWARQLFNSIAPGNFLWTNPEALKRMISTGGQSLMEGYRMWLEDLKDGELDMVDQSAYKLGKDIANTPGEVVFRNELLELIQYAPTTNETHQIPVVFIAPWINKYYILDIEPKKSLVRYLVSQGFTVFITSWKNPGPEMRDTTFEDYMTKGALKIIDIARKICDVEQVHAVGYCIGGTMLAALQAWAARGQDSSSPVAHWTLFTALIDFSSPGDMGAFITEDSIRWLEQRMEEQGYLNGRDMGTAFRWLRPNSLIWRYVVNNYLYGDKPPPLDVLQWNVDCTRLPKSMHSFYLREFYLNNRMIEPDALVLAERPIDLRKIKEPLYVVGTEQDHIAPWKETFKIAQYVSAPVRYVLASSGHILGILSQPVTPPKRHYWAGDASGLSDPDAWRQKIKKMPGSWWNDWVAWLREGCGPMVPARTPGSTAYPSHAHAPGVYVFEK